MTMALQQLPVWVGTSALVVAGLLSGVAVPRWQTDQAVAERALHLRAMAARPVPVADGGAQDWVSALPAGAQAPQRLADLAGLARQSGVVLDSVRQSAPIAMGRGALALTAEQLPLRLVGSGSYESWRRLVADALQHDDALLLQQLRLTRPTASSTLLAGELQWALLQRPVPAGPASTPALAPAAAGRRPGQGRS